MLRPLGEGNGLAQLVPRRGMRRHARPVRSAKYGLGVAPNLASKLPGAAIFVLPAENRQSSAYPCQTFWPAETRSRAPS